MTSSRTNILPRHLLTTSTITLILLLFIPDFSLCPGRTATALSAPLSNGGSNPKLSNNGDPLAVRTSVGPTVLKASSTSPGSDLQTTDHTIESVKPVEDSRTVKELSDASAADNTQTEIVEIPATESITESPPSSTPEVSPTRGKLTKMKNNLRWAFHGIVTELLHNVILRPLLKLRRPSSLLQNSHTSAMKKMEISQVAKAIDTKETIRTKTRLPPKNEIAVVTGATGGIGSEIVRDLAFRGYDVVIAARDVKRGEELVDDVLKGLRECDTNVGTSVDVVDGNGVMADEGDYSKDNVPLVTFVEYHADRPESAKNVASAIENLIKNNINEETISSNPTPHNTRKLTILINNAGIMGKSKQLTIKVNLIGPVLLTLALLPLMTNIDNSPATSASSGKEESEASSFTCSSASSCYMPMIINVGSSAHLRASSVFDRYSNDINGEHGESFLETIPDIPDSDLSTYAKSKLAIMQFSTLLRHQLGSNRRVKIHNSNQQHVTNEDTKLFPPVRIVDAHPGLVWTPLLRNHIGNAATDTLQKTGLANWIYKSPSEGASAIVSAVDYYASREEPSTSSDGGASKKEMPSREQVYFVNGRPGGYAASESRDLSASLRLWKEVILPEVEGMVKIPEGWGTA